MRSWSTFSPSWARRPSPGAARRDDAAFSKSEPDMSLLRWGVMGGKLVPMRVLALEGGGGGGREFFVFRKKKKEKRRTVPYVVFFASCQHST